MYQQAGPQPGPGFNAHLLRLVASGYYATVVIRENNDWYSVQIRAKDSLTADVAVITVNDAVHINVSSS